jgi:hypothetical protein
MIFGWAILGDIARLRTIGSGFRLHLILAFDISLPPNL